MKKKLSVLVMGLLLFSPVSTIAWNALTPAGYHEVTTAQARVGGYRSPVRSYRPSNNIIRKTPSYNQKSTNTKSSFFGNSNRRFFNGGGLMKGILLGGFAGLLFGNFLPHMGIFGQGLGLLTNILVIFLLIRLVLFFFRRRQPAQATMGGYGTQQQWQQGPNDQQQAYGSQATTESVIELDEDQLTNAMLTFYAHRQNRPLEELQVQFLYDPSNGFGADILQNGQVLETLDHFSMIQAIRYWAVEYGRLDANVDIDLHFSENQGVAATLKETN